MKILRFSHKYTKLAKLQHGEIITTIRKQLHGKHINQIVDVRLHHKHLCYAKIVKIEKKHLYELSDQLLLADVSPFADKRTDAISFISQFYRYPLQPTTTVYVLYLKKTEVLVL